MGFDVELLATKKKLGSRLKAYRESVPLTAIEVAAAIGTHRDTVHKIEAGAVASIDTMAKLLSQYGITLDDFLAGFRDKDIPEDQKEEHRKLKRILKSDFKAQADVVRAAIDSTYDKILTLEAAKKATDRPPPSPAKREGQDDMVGNAARRRDTKPQLKKKA